MWIIDNLKPTYASFWMARVNLEIALEKIWYPNNLLYTGDKSQVAHIFDMLKAYLKERDGYFATIEEWRALQ